MSTFFPLSFFFLCVCSLRGPLSRTTNLEAGTPFSFSRTFISETGTPICCSMDVQLHFTKLIFHLMDE